MTGHHHEPTGEVAETVDQPVKIDNPLYVRDYAKCILCYQCVDACGEQWQQTWAIGVAGRGFDARISTELASHGKLPREYVEQRGVVVESLRALRFGGALMKEAYDDVTWEVNQRFELNHMHWRRR